MTNTLFTTDTHFSHKNIIQYCNRPFKTVEEMNEVMIANWNSVVTPSSTIYHLGDVGFGDLRSILNRLNGKIILITGSHDKSALQCRDRFELVTPLLEIDIENEHITLCHYAMRVWPRSHYNSFHLFGHSHGRLSESYVRGDDKVFAGESYTDYTVASGKSFDVGVDGHNFFPWRFEEIREEMNKRPNNFNLVRKDE